MSVSVRKLLGTLAALSLVVAAGRLVLDDWLTPEALLDMLRAMKGAPWAYAAYVLLFGVATSLFLPAAMMMAIAGAVWGSWPGVLLAWVAGNVWSHIHFLLCRKMGFSHSHRWLTRPWAQRAMRELEQGNLWTTAMVRLLPLPYVVVNVAGGMSPVKWRAWAAGNALGLLPHSLIYPQLGSALLDGVAGARQEAAVRLLLAGSAVVMLGLLSRWAARRRTTE